MSVARYSGTYWDLAWWIMIGALAAWLALQLMATPVYGVPPEKAAVQHEQVRPASRLAPELVEAWAIAVDDFRCGDRSGAQDMLSGAIQQAAAAEFNADDDTALALWVILLDQAAGELDRAVAGWQGLELPLETAVWRYVAVAAACLESGDLQTATSALDGAWSVEPGNPLVHYYTALLYLEEARVAPDWYDAEQRRRETLVASSRPRVIPNSPSMYRLVASAELERAIATADTLDLDRELIPPEWTAEPSLRPLVRDLLWSMGAERFEGTAHHMLGHFMLERGNSDLAEEHFDAAVNLGVRILFGYGELADCYEEQGLHLDAARAHAKELQNRPGKGSAAVKLLDNLMRAMLDVAPY